MPKPSKKPTKQANTKHQNPKSYSLTCTAAEIGRRYDNIHRAAKGYKITKCGLRDSPLNEVAWVSLYLRDEWMLTPESYESGTNGPRALFLTVEVENVEIKLTTSSETPGEIYRSSINQNPDSVLFERVRNFVINQKSPFLLTAKIAQEMGKKEEDVKAILLYMVSRNMIIQHNNYMFRK